jgi:hypothetical protein
MNLLTEILGQDTIDSREDAVDLFFLTKVCSELVRSSVWKGGKRNNAPQLTHTRARELTVHFLVLIIEGRTKKCS